MKLFQFTAPFFYRINLLLCLLFFILTLIYIYFYGVSIPCYDELAIMPYFEKLFDRSLTWADLFSQHNEHRIFFPRIAMISIGICSRYNCFAEMAFTVFLFFIIFSVFYLKAGKQFCFNIHTIPLSFVIVPVIIFSWRHIDNLLWGVAIIQVMPVSFGVLSIYFIDELCNNKLSNRKKKLYFIYGIICSTVSSFSIMSGLLLWIIGFFQLLMGRYMNRHYIVLWTIAGISEWLLYFTGYKKPVCHPDLFYCLKEPFDFLIYFFTFTGGALFWDERTALIAGLVLFTLFILCLFLLFTDKRLRDNSFWLCIAACSLLTALSISIGRSGFGQSQALSSRYAHISMLFVIAVYMIATDLLVLKKEPLKKFIVGFLVFIILISVPFSYKYGSDRGKEFKIKTQYWSYILLNYKSQSDKVLKEIDPVTEEVRKGAEILEKYKWNIFVNPHPTPITQHPLF